jgi:WhiB family redox-sensing transcriptional regulator
MPHLHRGSGVSWQKHAACVGATAVFFADDQDSLGNNGRRGTPPGVYDRARRICQACPVQPECLATAMDDEEPERYGVWGGLAPDDRKQLRRRINKGQRR